MSQLLYRASLPVFVEQALSAQLHDQLSASMLHETGSPPSAAEALSWRRSLAALAEVLRRAPLRDAEVIVELFMPLNGRRCDALLLGRGADGVDSAVVVELKQWSDAQPSHLFEHVSLGSRPMLHPSAQARDYAATLQHFHSAFTGPSPAPRVYAAAYLHELRLGRAATLLRDRAVYGDLPVEVPIFLASEGGIFADWLVARLCPGPGAPLAERVAAGHALPSPKLLSQVVATIEGRYAWRLLDVQKTVYWQIRHAVQVARDTGQKRVVVVRGGPGTGKSVLALQLLADAARQGWVVAHATGSKAFQTVLQGQTLAFSRDLLKKIHRSNKVKDLPVADLFTTFAAVAQRGSQDPDRFDLVVCDEAHRLWRHRRMKYPSGTVRWLTDRPMVEELISASRVTAFFLDDAQSVRAGEIGRSDEIIHHATAMQIPVDVFDLDAQFRCAGSQGYIDWVESLFRAETQAPLDWREDGVYGLTLAPDAATLVAELRRLRQEGAHLQPPITARVVAGYCWRWSKPAGNGALPHDLVDPRFGGWSGAWIEKTGQHLKPEQHQYYKWATDDAYFEQVGSIYSAQGFEFDHVGVIWGEDLVRRGDRWVAQLDANKDAAFKKDLRAGGEDPVSKLMHVYRVLLTRGMRSTSLCILDDETRAFVASRLEPQVRYWREEARSS